MHCGWQVQVFDFALGLFFGDTDAHLCVSPCVCMHALDCHQLRKFRQDRRPEGILGRPDARCNQTSKS